MIKTLIRSHNSYALLSLTALHRQVSYFLAALLIFAGWKCWNSLTLTYLSSILLGGFPYKKTWMLVISRLFSGRRGSESFIWIGTPPPLYWINTVDQDDDKDELIRWHIYKQQKYKKTYDQDDDKHGEGAAECWWEGWLMTACYDLDCNCIRMMSSWLGMKIIDHSTTILYF